jgi:hypothetical protein
MTPCATINHFKKKCTIMQVNISFNGATIASPIATDQQTVASDSITISDAGVAPGSDEQEVSSFAPSANLVAQVGAQVDIGTPPGWLYEAIAAHKLAMAADSSETPTGTEGQDGGAGPA